MGQTGNCYVLSDFRYAGGLYARYWRCMENQRLKWQVRVFACMEN
jgi:hypothetical protein